MRGKNEKMEITKKEIQLLAQILKNEHKITTKIIKKCDPDTSRYEQRTKDLFSSLEEIKSEAQKIAVKNPATATRTETKIAADGQKGAEERHGDIEVRTRENNQVQTKNENSSSKTRKKRKFLHGRQPEENNFIAKSQDFRRFRRPRQITGPGPPKTTRHQ